MKRFRRCCCYSPHSQTFAFKQTALLWCALRHCGPFTKCYSFQRIIWFFFHWNYHGLDIWSGFESHSQIKCINKMVQTLKPLLKTIRTKPNQTKHSASTRDKTKAQLNCCLHNLQQSNGTRSRSFDTVNFNCSTKINLIK